MFASLLKTVECFCKRNVNHSFSYENKENYTSGKQTGETGEVGGGELHA